MPQITTTAILQLTLLLSALPAQFLISKWTRGSAVERFHAIKSLLKAWNDLRLSYLNASAWGEWVTSWVPEVTFFDSPEEEEDVEDGTPPIEVLLQDNDLGYFGASKDIHSPRPAYVLHRVGQVVMENQNHMVGVIVGWDAELRAPSKWIKKRYTESELQSAADSPHYKVVFSGPASTSIMVGYLPQSTLKLIRGYKPDIPTLDMYFSDFDGGKFVMLPWLEQIYPED
ncbi:si:dkey-261l7.2 [Clupea harengus]|uniref:Si:dkey-261l7.2 n=1 Tax=Clupea harengus TaxID=7950 RepID=A0A6P8GF35_CLUHA|nr:si:dkey-261l7.2 [Clupea harengus]